MLGYGEHKNEIHVLNSPASVAADTAPPSPKGKLRVHQYFKKLPSGYQTGASQFVKKPSKTRGTLV